jgi:hypothetical protein
MVMKYINWALRREVYEPGIPECPDHKIQMRLRGMLGRPARFTRQTEGEYTYVYFCPRDDCDQSAMRNVAKSQAPVPGEAPERPFYARAQDNQPKP